MLISYIVNIILIVYYQVLVWFNSLLTAAKLIKMEEKIHTGATAGIWLGKIIWNSWSRYQVYNLF